MKPLAKLGEKFSALAKKLGKKRKPKKVKKTKVGGAGKGDGKSGSGNNGENKSKGSGDQNDKPDNPKTPPPSKKEIELAKSEGDTLENRAARDKVSRHYMENNGYTDDQSTEALGSADGSRFAGVDLSKPVAVVSFPPPDQCLSMLDLMVILVTG